MSDLRRGKPVERVSVKVGLERVLYRAATDRAFRGALLADREAALRGAGLVLSEGEAAVLAVVDRDTLAAMIDAVQPRARPQRPFLRAVAATCVVLATGAAAVESAGCGGSCGIRDDIPEPGRDAAAWQDVASPSDTAAPEVPVVPDDTPTRGIETDDPGFP